jgi:hypothetical protein
MKKLSTPFLTILMWYCAACLRLDKKYTKKVDKKFFSLASMMTCDLNLVNMATQHHYFKQSMEIESDGNSNIPHRLKSKSKMKKFLPSTHTHWQTLSRGCANIHEILAFSLLASCWIIEAKRQKALVCSCHIFPLRLNELSLNEIN